MIVSLVGRADNHTLVFTKSEGEQWEATVPTDFSDGTYIVELWATDDYGNVAYYTAILYIFDGRTTYLEILEDSFQVLILSDKFNFGLDDNPFELNSEPERYSVNVSERLVVVM